MKLAKMLLGVLVCAVLVGGCTKKVNITIANHSDVTRTVQLSTPDETMTVGAVSAGGRLATVLTVNTGDLPAQCRLSAGAGADQSFMVTEDSPSKWWFHITKDGKLAGPYGKADVHAETEKTTDIQVPVRRTTVLK
jgi:hypothetical protein